MSNPRPITGDEGNERVVEFISVDQTWLLTTPGEYETCAVESMTNDGGSYQRVVAVKLPVRVNGTQEHSELRLMMHPEHAIGLAENLMHSAIWLMEHPE